MRRVASILVILILSAAMHGKAQKTLDQLRAEAEKATGGHQAMLYAELADRLVEQADHQFTQGESVKGQATVQEILDVAIKARDGGVHSRRKLKETEIHLRQTQRHLENVRRTLSAEDRPEVEAVEKKLSDFRQELLNAMFSPKEKEEKK